MKLGSLFSGAGLGDLGWMMAGFDIKWQVEVDDYCRNILDLRFPETKKYGDIKTIRGAEIEPVDIIAGGFPCQPFSVAGKQMAERDDRNLWPEMFRIIREVRPQWVVAENVPGIIPIYLDTVLADLEGEGYTCWPFVFSAHSLGAPHKRDRLWIVGNAGLFGPAQHEKQTEGVKQSSQAVPNTSNPRIERVCGREESTDENVADTRCKSRGARFRQAGEVENGNQFGNGCGNMANPDGNNAQRFKPQKSDQKIWQGSLKGQIRSCSDVPEWWATEPAVGRVVNGMPNRVDRLKALGNGQVVACTAFIGRRIMEFENIIN